VPRVCTICVHPERLDIEAALVAGEPCPAIAALYRVSEDALLRHKQNHLPAHLAKAQEAAEVVQADGLLARLLSLNGETMEILKEAREGKVKDNELALKAIARAEKQLELQAKLLGELNDGTTVNVLVAPEWLALRGAIIRALEPYPEAKQAVVKVLN
jgi:hypothetical protein